MACDPFFLLGGVVVKSTRLRYIRAKSIDDLSEFVSSLPFKIEIKGYPVKDGKRWLLWFIPPDSVEIGNTNL